ncbi:hypothetical protein HMP0721_0267 [Pseudoramibacter alactolyticus ATCC 23263]|uniref:Protein PsiE n=1 Tax=Pseudoramibacter alactolyticus ATCC 23263 TaxID=887929 RepID=E6ME34_9FIRM|nr:phosphate-starvation-inducible PsiE family protein [Pseudoramibacter alactolyticus]EFV02793.1 hypothetical protein HMP0721_0267 [Pseudoramibacter alactolyticus ATCC 23263]
MERLKNGALKFYEVVLEILEMGIALFLVVLIAMNLFELFAHIEFNASLTVAFKTLQTCLGLCMNLIICTEFIRMVYTHTMQAVLEALIFAIARGLIVGHLNGEQTLLYIVAILLLMVMRKYLLRDSDEGGKIFERVRRLMAQTRTHDQKEDKEKLKSAASGHDNESFL